MSLEVFKFMVQAVVVERDEQGEIIGEKVTEPVALYTAEKLAEWAMRFPDELAKVENEPSPDEAAPGQNRQSRRAAATRKPRTRKP